MRKSGVRALIALSLVLVALLSLAACSRGQQAQAGKPAGGDVEVYRGTHTVYHSMAPLPSAEQPRKDGRYTLVWFSATG